mgnify:CR=1 FL=1
MTFGLKKYPKASFKTKGESYMNYILSCCSCADLSLEYVKRRDIHFINFHFMIDGTEYPDDMGQTISPEELFKRMDAGADTKTSQISVMEYIEYFEEFLKQGLDILHVTLSSGLSGTYNSAIIAADTLKEKYPDRKLYIVDSLGASSGYGLIVDTLADKRDEGMDIDSLYTWVMENRLCMHHWFFSTDLTYYIRGGRVSKPAGYVGKLLNICPLLNMDHLGHLTPREKVRGEHHVANRTLEKMIAHADGGTSYSGKC